MKKNEKNRFFNTLIPHLLQKEGNDLLLPMKFYTDFHLVYTSDILKFQSLDSEFKNKLVPFGELEFGDTLCFERETNKIVVYNHENDTIELVANDWNGFMAKLYDDFNSKKRILF